MYVQIFSLAVLLEVDVGGFGLGFGVCGDYWKEKNGNNKMDDEEGLFWDVLRRTSNYIRLTISPFLLQCVLRPIG
jgi:hypothetical protein